MTTVHSKDNSWSEQTRAAISLLGEVGVDDVALGPYCTYRVGGPAARLIDISNDTVLDHVASVVAETGVQTLVVGNGSNLLVADAGFDGLALVLGSDYASISYEQTDAGETVAELGGATMLPVAARATVRAGLTGFEWAVGVPGSVGGAVRMNAGGHGADMAASLVRAQIVDLSTGEREWWGLDQLSFGYRTSAIEPHHLVTRAELRLTTADSGAEARLTEIVRWRREHQPGGANAGSVFANPPGDSAGRLIDAAGLKGHRIGSASVSTKHANFIQADPGGSADDIAALIADVSNRVEKASGVRLQPENKLVGFATTHGPSASPHPTDGSEA